MSDDDERLDVEEASHLANVAIEAMTTLLSSGDYTRRDLEGLVNAAVENAS